MQCAPSFEIHGGDRGSEHIILCDHATNIVPDCVNGGDLGLPDEDMERHIAFDIGALGVASELGRLLDAPVVFSKFSRLVIDPNRSHDDPTALRRLYDGSLIPANRYADKSELKRRLDKFHGPYHDAIAKLVASRNAPVITSMHSFTPQLRGHAKRPWQVGVLFARDRRLSDPLIASLQAEADLTIGINQPYSGELEGDTMDQHALSHGHLHALIEIRNDLIETEEAQSSWAARLAPHIIQATKIAKENAHG